MGPESRSPKPIEESTDDDEVPEATDDLPALGSLFEAATSSGLLLLRSIDRESRIEVLVIHQELLILRMEG